MRSLVSALLTLAALCAFPAFADVYNVSAVMPCTSGATQAKLYINGTGQVLKPCGTAAQAYQAAIPTEGSYSFAYSGVSATGLEGARGPSVTHVIDKAPGTPPNPPTVTIQCRDAGGASVTCPPNITITTSP